MAANTLTSGSGTVSGTDPNFILTYKTNNNSGVVLMVNYTKGTEASISITLDVVNKSLHATDKYRMITMSGATVSAWTFTISATGKYRIPIEIIDSEKIICANITYATAGQDGVCVANFMEG